MHSNSLQNDRCSFFYFIFKSLLVHTITLTISTRNLFPCFSQFLPPYFTLICKIFLTIPTNIPFLYTSAIFHLPIFVGAIATIYVKVLSLLQPSSKFRWYQETNQQRSLLRTDPVLTSLLFVKVKSEKTGLRITDSLSLRLRKLVYCR